MSNKNTKHSAIWLLLLLAAILVTGCSDDDNPVTPPASVDEFNAILESGTTFITSGTPVIKAVDLYNNLHDGDTTNDPFILSIRGATDYAAGHIPGAVNIGFRDIAKPASLAQLPTDKQIVVVCYTGHTASQTTMLLNMLGYDAIALKFGMASWTMDTLYNPSVLTNRPFDVALDCGDYPVDTGSAASTTHALPSVDNTQSNDIMEIVRVAGDTYLSSGAPPVIKAVDLYNNLHDGNTANDPFVLSVRGSNDFKSGHIPGAINIPWREISDTANLAKLPTDKEIVVCCYTGHTASMVTMYLNTLGYDAVCLKFGMTSWTVDPTKNPSITSNRYFDPALDCGDYPVETGGLYL